MDEDLNQVRDTELWRRHAKGAPTGPDAFRALYERHQRRIVGTAGLILHGRQADANDVAQDVAAALLEHRSGPPEGVSFLRWMYGMVRNKCYAAIGRRQRPEGNPVVNPVDDAPSANETLEQAAELRRLRAAIDELPEPDRQIIAARFRFGLNREETAAELGITPQWVTKRTDNILKGLRAQLEN